MDIAGILQRNYVGELHVDICRQLDVLHTAREAARGDRAAGEAARILQLSLAGILDGLLGVAEALLDLAGNLLGKTFHLLLLASRQLAGLFLHFACDVFCRTFHLILVHVCSLIMVE
jgi:hypothetical protein